MYLEFSFLSGPVGAENAGPTREGPRPLSTRRTRDLGVPGGGGPSSDRTP